LSLFFEGDEIYWTVQDNWGCFFRISGVAFRCHCLRGFGFLGVHVNCPERKEVIPSRKCRHLLGLVYGISLSKLSFFFVSCGGADSCEELYLFLRLPEAGTVVSFLLLGLWSRLRGLGMSTGRVFFGAELKTDQHS
jgi:hypothetical protein